MGVICKSIKSSRYNKKELIEIKVENNDFSFVYSVYNSLFILNKFKNFILEYHSNSIYMGNTLNEIFKQNDEEKMNNLIMNSKKIIYRIKKEKFNFGTTAGSIIMEILDLLKKEQLLRKYESNSDDFANPDYKIALQKYVESHRLIYSDNKFSELFHGLLKRQILYNQNIVYTFEYFSYIELNLVDIFNKLSNEGRVFYNAFNVPEINLIDAIREEFSPRSSTYNNSASIEQKSIYCTAPYLIFILNSKKTVGEQVYNYFNVGKIVYGQEIDISYLAEYPENKNRYRISSIIKEKNINNNNNDKSENYINNNVDENGQFYYYENNIKINGIFIKEGYYEQVLIYKQLKD